MWTAARTGIDGREGELLSIAAGGRPLDAGETIALWRDDAAFRDFFIAELAATQWPGFFWEMPPLQSAMLSRPFECALIRSDALARMRADDRDFTMHLRGPETISVFPNLSGDAFLIAPRRIASAECYGHIAAFLRDAPREQQHALLRMLAREIEVRLAALPYRFWVSTSGLGVPWVHVRLDTYPKYYQHRPYRDRE
jgi:hypothetical protein